MYVAVKNHLKLIFYNDCKYIIERIFAMSEITKEEKNHVENELRKITRRIEVHRRKKFCLNKLGCKIFLDGRAVGFVDNGKVLCFEVDGLPHQIACQWLFADSLYTTPPLTIPYGTETLIYTTTYVIQQSKQFTLKGLNITSSPVGVLNEDSDSILRSNALFRQTLQNMLKDFRENL